MTDTKRTLLERLDIACNTIEKVSAVSIKVMTAMVEFLKLSMPTIGSVLDGRIAGVIDSCKGETRQIIFDLYDKHFSEAELAVALAFYESPEGKKFMNASPEIEKELQEALTDVYVRAFEPVKAEMMKSLEREFGSLQEDFAEFDTLQHTPTKKN